MKWSVTLPRLPGLGGIPMSQHQYKEKVQIVKGFPRTWVLTGKQFQDFKQRNNKNIIVDPPKKPSGTQGSQRCQMNMAHVHSKN